MIPAPSLIPNLFRYQNFSETQHKKVPLRNVRYCEAKPFSTENLDTPLRLLYINFFATGNFLKHSTDGSFYKAFQHCETKKFRRKSLILPPFIHQLFRYRQISETQYTRVPLRNFSALRDRKFLTEIVILPPPRTYPKTFCYRKFSKTQHKRVPLLKFSALRDKMFLTENRDTPSLPPPILSNCLFDTRNFVKHRGVPHAVFRYCETTKFIRKILILRPSPLHSYPLTFSLPEIF